MHQLFTILLSTIGVFGALVSYVVLRLVIVELTDALRLQSLSELEHCRQTFGNLTLHAVVQSVMRLPMFSLIHAVLVDQFNHRESECAYVHISGITVCRVLGRFTV